MNNKLMSYFVQLTACWLLSTFVFLVSCSKDSTTPPPPTPTVTSFTPASAFEGASVTITGTNFSATAANNTVKFGDVAAQVTAATTASLTVTVPAGLSLSTSYSISVSTTANNKTSSTATSIASFMYEISGLVAYYKFAGDTKDYSGQGNDLTATDITYVNDHSGGANSAASFNGTTSKAISSDGTDFGNSTSASISMWIYRKTNSGYLEILIGNSLDSYNILDMDDSPSGVGISSCGINCDAVANPVDQDSWHHVVGLYDAAVKQFTLYIDNVQVKKFTSGAEPATILPTLDWVFGYYYGSVYWQGYIGKTRIYNRVLTEAEITALYNE